MTDPRIFTSITPVIRTIRLNKSSFPSIKFNREIPNSQYIKDQISGDLGIKIQDSWANAEWYCKNICHIKDNIVRKFINLQKKKNSRIRMEPWETLALTRHSWENFPFRTSRSSLLQRNEESRPKIVPETRSVLTFVKTTSMPNPLIY